MIQSKEEYGLRVLKRDGDGEGVDLDLMCKERFTDVSHYTKRTTTGLFSDNLGK
jgi:CTP synthase (UTP-ammonia lyase)